LIRPACEDGGGGFVGNALFNNAESSYNARRNYTAQNDYGTHTESETAAAML